MYSLKAVLEPGTSRLAVRCLDHSDTRCSSLSQTERTETIISKQSFIDEKRVNQSILHVQLIFDKIEENFENNFV